LAPPNVKGWPGGESWINSATLLGRKQLIDRLFRNEDRIDAAMRNIDQLAMQGGEAPPPGAQGRMQRQLERQMGGIRWDLDKWSARFVTSGGSDPRLDMARVVLAIAPQSPLAFASDTTVSATSTPADWARQLVRDPVYQLK
jgi:hypothetical protein